MLKHRQMLLQLAKITLPGESEVLGWNNCARSFNMLVEKIIKESELNIPLYRLKMLDLNLHPDTVTENEKLKMMQMHRRRAQRMLLPNQMWLFSPEGKISIAVSRAMVLAQKAMEKPSADVMKSYKQLWHLITVYDDFLSMRIPVSPQIINAVFDVGKIALIEIFKRLFR